MDKEYTITFSFLEPLAWPAAVLWFLLTKVRA